MARDQVMSGVPGTRYREMDYQELDGGSSSALGWIVKIVLGLVIAVDTSLLAAPLYFGTINPCNMVAISNASQHASAADDEISLSDEMAMDVFQASSYWVRSQESLASCAGEIGGRTLSGLMP